MKRFPFLDLSLWNLLFFGFIIIVLISSILVNYSIDLATNELRNETIKNTLLMTSESMNKIDRSISHRIDEMEVYASAQTLIQELKKSNQFFSELNEPLQLILEREKEWRTAPVGEITPFMNELINNEASIHLRHRLDLHFGEKVDSTYQEVIVADAFGANAAITGKTTDYYQADEEWWQKAKEEGIYFGGIEFDESTKVNSFSASIQILDEKGKFIGATKAVLNLLQVIEALEDFKKTSGNDFILLNSEGKIIYSTYKTQDSEKLIEIVFRDLLQGNKGFFLNQEEGKEIFYSFSQSEGFENFYGLGWVLVERFSLSAAYQSVNELRNKLFLISVFILVLGIFVSFFIATYISMSINRLDKELQEISRGNLKIELKKSKIKEFNNLINSFERILVSMKLAIAQTKQENRKGKEETEKNNIRKF